MSKFTEIDLSYLIKERPIEEVIIFNYNPTLKDVEEAFNNDQIIVFNCYGKNLHEVEALIESVHEEQKRNFAVFYYPMENEEFEKYIRSSMTSPWFPDCGTKREELNE